MTDPSLREEIRRNFETALEARRQVRLAEERRLREQQRAADERRRKAAARETWAGCLTILVILGLVAWGAWWVLAGISDWLHTPVKTRPTTATSQSPRPAPVWKLDPLTDGYTKKDSLLWTDMDDSTELRLLDNEAADDAHSARTDYLDDDKGLTSADVEITLTQKPEHGTLELQPDKGRALYTPAPGFGGQDTFDYTIKLRGKPEQRNVKYVVDVGLSPGARYYQEHKYENCSAARAAGATPLRRGEDGYGRHLDADMDGIACE